MTTTGPLLPATPGQQTQPSDSEDEEQPGRPPSARPPRLVGGVGGGLSSVEAAADGGGGGLEEYLEDWQRPAHCGGAGEKAAHHRQSEARGRAAAGVEDGAAAAVARPPRSFGASAFAAATGAGDHCGGRTLPPLTHTRRQSPASEDRLLPTTSDSGAWSQASRHCRHGGGGGTRLWRQRRWHTGSCGVQLRDQGRDVVSYEDEDAAVGGCCSTPGLVEQSSRRLASSASASSRSALYAGGPPQNTEVQRGGEEGGSSSYWRGGKAGWATLWLCPKSPLFCLQRVAVGFVYLSCCAYSMCILSVVSDQFYDPQKGPTRLHDRIHDQVLASQPFWLATPFLVDVLTVGLLVVTLIRHLLFIPLSIGLLVGQRLLFLLGTMYILRGLALVITTVPPSKAHCDPPRVHKASDLFCFSMQQCFSLRSECTGMIISGHSITTCCSMAVWLVYGDAPAVPPLQNLRAAYAYMREALRLGCRKRRGGSQQAAGEVHEREEEEVAGRGRADGRAAASTALLPACAKTRSSAAGAASPLCEDDAGAAEAAETPPQQRGHQLKRSQGRPEDVGGERAAGGVVEGVGEGRRKGGGGTQGREREVVLQLVDGDSWDKPTHETAAAAAPAAAHREAGVVVQVGARRRATHEGEDHGTTEEEEGESGEPSSCETNAGTCSNWSTEVDLEGRPRRTSADAVPLRGEGGSLTGEEDTHSRGTGEWRLSSHRNREEGEKASQESPSLQQRVSLLWHRCCRLFTWQYVRQHLLTASLLRVVCLLVGCTNLLFIVLSFNHYTVDVFMAINFTLGAWSFYHFVVALLWSERLTNKCVARAAAVGLPYYECIDSSAPPTPQGWLRLGGEECQLEDAEAVALPGAGRGEGRLAGGATTCGTAGGAEEAYTEAARQEEGLQCGAGATATTSSSSACCVVCHRNNSCGGETANKKREAAGEHSDSLTDTSTTTATPEKHAPGTPFRELDRTGQGRCSSGSSRSNSCGDSPLGGKRKTVVVGNDGAFDRRRSRSRRARPHDDEWLLDLKDTAGPLPSRKRQELCQQHEKTQGKADAACLPIFSRSSEKAREAPSEFFCHDPCHSSAAAAGDDAAVRASGRTVLHKQRVPASCAEPTCRRRRVLSSTEAESCSTSGRGGHFSDSVISALVRSSRRTLRLPLLQPAINAIRLVEGM